jgi:hypothetical protein
VKSPRILWYCAWLFGLIFAAHPLAADPAANAAVPYGEGRLWRVTAPSGAKSYVFGTMHSAHPRVVAVPEPIYAALRECRVLLPELAMSASEISQAMLAAMAADREQSLTRVIEDRDLLARVAKALRKRGLPAASAREMPAWSAIFLLMAPVGNYRSPVAPGQVLDLLLIDEARRRGMEVVALETPEIQFGIFKGLDNADQVRVLRLMVDGQSWLYGQESGRFTLENYLAGRNDRLYRALTEREGEELVRIVNRRLLHDRNHGMVERMTPYFLRGGAFTAVGALHLPGEEGVLNLLAQQGFRVEREY